MNGAAPADVPLSDIDLGSWDFWGLDDDVRDGAFATLRREAPVVVPRVVRRRRVHARSQATGH